MRSDLEASRRSFLKVGGLTVAATALTGTTARSLRAVVAPQLAASDLSITHGVVTGDVTDRSARLWCRASGDGAMRIVYGKGDKPRRAGLESIATELIADRDFIGQFSVGGLEAATTYWYRPVIERPGRRWSDGPVATFRTAPAPTESVSVRFAWGGDVGQEMDNRPPFPSFGSIADEEPDFFLFNGDTIYGDDTTPAGPGATTVPEYWAKYKENREDPLFQALAARTPMIINWDDHEVANDYRGKDLTVPPGRVGVGRTAFMDYWPVTSSPDKTWRALRWGREVEVFVLDCRQYADPLRLPDTPSKTMLGSEQVAWLRDAVMRSTTRWKVLVTSCPLSTLRSATPPHDDWASYEHELRSLLDPWKAAAVKNIVWLTADVHWAQAVEYPGYGMWEFVGSPIGANPRTEEMPLSPTFNPTSHFLGLGQRYYGSIFVDARARKMTVDFKLEDGTLRHRTEIPAA